jgi:hypothetical protein
MNTRAAWAQEAETKMLDLIEAASGTGRVKTVAESTVLSTTRDFIAAVIRLAAQERRRQRMAPDAMLRVMAPTWLLDTVQEDIIRSGTSFVDGPPQVVARDYLVAQMRAVNVNISFYWDSSTAGAQLMLSQSGSGAQLNSFPETVRWYLFHEGMFVHGDGGTLDVGIIRDSTLVNTNDFRVFVESFETIFTRGLFGYVVDQTLCPNGTSSATLDIHTHCEGS